jgi:serine/threonine protein kinase
VVHGDIAPENLILQTNGLIKLVDFGVARRIEDPQHEFRVAGRMNYRAPELKTSGQTTFEGDVYAVGKIFEQLLGDQFLTEKRSETLNLLLEKRELPKLDLDQGWFKGVDPMPPLEVLHQPTIIRAKTKILSFEKSRISPAMLHGLLLLAAFPFLTSWLPQFGLMTINTLPASMIMLEDLSVPPGHPQSAFRGVPMVTPIQNFEFPSGPVRVHFVVPSQQNRRVIREVMIRPNEHLKFFEDFRKN